MEMADFDKFFFDLHVGLYALKLRWDVLKVVALSYFTFGKSIFNSLEIGNFSFFLFFQLFSPKFFKGFSSVNVPIF